MHRSDAFESSMYLEAQTCFFHIFIFVLSVKSTQSKFCFRWEKFKEFSVTIKYIRLVTIFFTGDSKYWLSRKSFLCAFGHSRASSTQSFWLAGLNINEWLLIVCVAFIFIHTTRGVCLRTICSHFSLVWSSQAWQSLMCWKISFYRFLLPVKLQENFYYKQLFIKHLIFILNCQQCHRKVKHSTPTVWPWRALCCTNRRNSRYEFDYLIKWRLLWQIFHLLSMQQATSHSFSTASKRRSRRSAQLWERLA